MEKCFSINSHFFLVGVFGIFIFGFIYLKKHRELCQRNLVDEIRNNLWRIPSD